MNTDSRKGVGETAPTGVLASESNGEPDQKCESPLTTVENEKNENADTQALNANGSSKNLDGASTESTSEKTETKEMESSPKKDEKNSESSGDVNTDKESANLKDVGSTQKASPSQSSSDPYAYVDRGDFTSEKFKIEIRGFPKFYGYGELKRFLNTKLKLSSHKVKLTRKKSPWIFVCFKNEEDRQAAIKTLNRVTWKGKMLTASMAKPAPDPLVKKRRLQDESGSPEKKPRISDDERLKNSTTPYWNLEYEQQLQKKYDYVKGIMCNLANFITNVNPMLSTWVKRQKAKYNGMICNLLDIRKSPICDGYRNKCEFTVGINEETKQRMVGFRLGSYVQGQVGVGPIDSLKHIPQRMKETVKVFEKFVQSSTKEPFNPETHTGHWRLLTLRLTTIGELMVVVVVNSKGKTKEELTAAKEEVKEFFENGDGKVLKVDSLYFQAVGKRESGKEPPMEHLLGATHITEELLGLKFRISPEAFFQVNTPGAGVLYSSVGELIDLTPTTTLVDVCCGTGTIGLSLAKKCGQVLGLEVVAPAIEDAKVNANENNITNCEFFTGRAEEILTSVLTRAKGKSVYAIVDPPRSGLQQKGIIALRGAEVVDKIVYVSCDPNAALKNFVDLARQTSKTYHGLPLVPICAVPVDMFPHTAHCEVVLLFHRVNPINLPKSMPPSKDDVALLTKSLADTPPTEPNSQVPERKNDKGEVEKGKPLSSDSKNTMSSNKSSFSSADGPQGKKLRRVISGDIRKEKYKQMGRHFPIKGFGNKGLSQPKSNNFERTRLSRFEQQRALKQSFNQDRSAKFSRPGRVDKNPDPWLHNENRNKWKEGESFSDRNAGIWKEGPSPLMSEGMRVSGDLRYGGSRGGWKEDRPAERENRGWGGNHQQLSESRWHEMGQRRDDLGTVEEPRRRDVWKRDGRNEGAPGSRRWRDEEVELPSTEMLGRRKLEREVEQLLASRRVCLEERQQMFPRDDDTNWSQPGNHRQPDNYPVTEPRWADRGMDRTLENERMRIDRERSPVRGMSPVQSPHIYERQMSPVHKREGSPSYNRYSSPVRKRQESPMFERRESWCERRVSREDMGDPVDFRDRFQDLDEKMPMREERHWNDRIGYKSVEFEEKAGYRAGRDSDEINNPNEPTGYRVRDYGSRRSPGICDVDLKPEFPDVYPERMEIRVGGGGFESPKHNYALQERGGVSLRQTEQTNLRSPYGESQPFPPRDKISIANSGRLSQERISNRFDDAGRSYRGSDPDIFRGPNDIPSSRFSKGENSVPDRYLSPKERNVNFDRTYESKFLGQGFGSFEENRNKPNVGKADLISRPIVADEEYRMKGHNSRELCAPDDFVPNLRERNFPVDGPKNVHHRESSGRLGGWNEPVLGRRRSPSPVHFNERNDDRYTRRNFVDESEEPWTRNRDQEEITDWRANSEKDRSDKRYTARGKAMMPESRDSNHNFSMPNRYNRSPRREPKSRFRDKDSPPKVEKAFPFSLPRASQSHNVQKLEDTNRIPALTLYSSTSNQLPFVPGNVVGSSAANLNPGKQMNSKHFGSSSLAQNMGFDNPSFQGSHKLKPLDYNSQGPSQPQVPLGNFRQPAFTSTTGVISPWNNVGVSPWDRTHNQPW